MLSSCHVVDKEGMRVITQEDIPRIQGFYLVGQSFGDLMCMMPVVHKVCAELVRKLDVWTLRPELFKNDPFVGQVRRCDPLQMHEYVSDGNVLIMCPILVKGAGSQADMNLVDFAALHITKLSAEEKEIALYPDAQDGEKAVSLLAPVAHLPKIVVHPNKNFPIRTWPSDRWYALAARFLDEGYAVVAVGHDMHNIGDAVDGTDKTMQPFSIDHPHFLSVVNETSIHEVLEVIKVCQLVVTVDSGILHIANSTEVPVVGIYTEINPELRMRVRNGSIGYRSAAVSAPCEFQYCSTHFGMRDNQCKFSDERYLGCLPTVDSVYAAAIDLMRSCDG